MTTTETVAAACAIVKVWCETCGGIGTIDETLGGIATSNPEAECPDCDGHGYNERRIESALASAEPVAWFKSVFTPAGPYSPEEYDIALDWGRNPPDGAGGWSPLYTHAQPAAKVEAARFETSPEDRFEQFVQAEIARSPKPLQELGEYLTRVLDEDEFPTANRLLLQLAVEYSTPASVPDGLQNAIDYLRDNMRPDDDVWRAIREIERAIST